MNNGATFNRKMDEFFKTLYIDDVLKCVNQCITDIYYLSEEANDLLCKLLDVEDAYLVPDKCWPEIKDFLRYHSRCYHKGGFARTQNDLDKQLQIMMDAEDFIMDYHQRERYWKAEEKAKKLINKLAEIWKSIQHLVKSIVNAAIQEEERKARAQKRKVKHEIHAHIKKQKTEK